MNDLNWEIIKILSNHKSLETHELHKMLQSYKKVSLANIYKAIALLQDRAIIQKDKKQISLNTFWVINFHRLAEQMLQTHLYDTPDLEKLKDGEKFIITKSSFLDFDKIWIDMIGKILLANDQEFDAYFYNTHNYQLLITPQTELPFFSKVVKLARKSKFLI